jgi:ABC-type glycerol-3-phosphate transport system substrate-binding protein
MTKKITLVLLVAFVCFGTLFAAATPEKEGNPSIEMLMWVGADRLNYLKTIYEKTTSLSSNEMANITFTSGGTGATDSYQLFRLKLASNDAPGIVFFGGETAATEFIMNGDILNITSEVKDQMNDILPSAVDLASYKGEVYGLPTQVKSKVWYYREDLFREAGINVGEIKTFDDFYSAGMKFKEHFPEKYFINLGPTPNVDVVIGWLGSYDNLTIADEAGNFRITTDPRFRDMYEKLYKLATAPFSLYVSDWDSDWQPNIENGTIASLLSWSWMTEFLPSYAPNQSGLWAITAWPEEFGYGGCAELISIPTATSNKAASVEVLKTLYLDSDGAVLRFKENGLLPVTYSGVEKVNAAVADIAATASSTSPLGYFGTGMVDDIFATMKYATKYNSDPSFNAEEAIIENHLNLMITGIETIDQAIANTQKDLIMQVGNPYDI